MTLQRWQLIRVFNIGWVYENLKENKQICLKNVEILLKKTLLNPNDNDLDDIYEELQKQLIKTKDIINNQKPMNEYDKKNYYLNESFTLKKLKLRTPVLEDLTINLNKNDYKTIHMILEELQEIVQDD